MSDDTKKGFDATFDGFRSVVEQYGSDPERWPDQPRAALQSFALENQDAQDLLQEYRALEHVLQDDADPSGEPVTLNGDLADRILRAADACETHPEQLKREDGLSSGSVVDLTTKRNRRPVKLPRSTPNTHSVWAAGALAASLVLGVFAGWSGFANSALAPVSDALGVAAFGDDSASSTDPIFDLVDAGGFGDDIL